MRLRYLRNLTHEGERRKILSATFSLISKEDDVDVVKRAMLSVLQKIRKHVESAKKTQTSGLMKIFETVLLFILFSEILSINFIFGYHFFISSQNI